MQWIESGIELDGEFQIQDGNELAPIQKKLFVCAWNLLLESTAVPNSNSCLDVQTMKFDVLLSLGNINLCTRKK
jgi:hypothetical protein